MELNLNFNYKIMSYTLEQAQVIWTQIIKKRANELKHELIENKKNRIKNLNIKEEVYSI